MLKLKWPNTSPVSRARAPARESDGNQRPWPADKVERWLIDRLIPYARNARTHSDEQVAQIAASIREFGFTNPVLPVISMTALHKGNSAPRRVTRCRSDSPDNRDRNRRRPARATSACH